MPEKRRESAGRLAAALGLPDWSLRRKLALALTIPMLLAATFGGLRVHAQLSEADSYSATASQVTVLRPAVAYLAAAERAAVTGRSTPLLTDPARVDAIDAVANTGGRLEQAGEQADLTVTQQEELEKVLGLSVQLRDGTAYLSVGQAVSQLRQLQRSVTELIDAIVVEQIEPEPRLQMLEQALDGRVSLAMQQFQVASNSGRDANPVDLAAELGVEAATLDRLGASLGTTQEQVLALNQQNAAHFGAVRAGTRDLGGPEAFEAYDALTDDLLDGIDSELSDAVDHARVLAIVNSAITLAALLAAVLLALYVSRLLLNPIRRVREGALEVAHQRLPDTVARIRGGEQPGEIVPIDVTTREEMGELARAVDDLHAQAVHLAAGEARFRTQVGDMFQTLSRRNTSLINQQLGLIERLEKDEQEPSRLESLFRLDHLASRMRRTGDSLMVLADASSPTGDKDALALGDVFQAAMAGVQEYRRVQADTTASEMVNGVAAADVVHLMTELVDNALAFSPPDAVVTISSALVAEARIVEVSDGGLGIAREDLEALNKDLSSGGEVTPETARRMGLLVVSRLAQRHGITVSLARNSRGGTTATVVLPAALLRGRRLAGSAPAPVRKRREQESRHRAAEPVAEPATQAIAPVEVPVLAADAPVAEGVRLPQRRPGSDHPPEPAREPESDLVPERVPAPAPTSWVDETPTPAAPPAQAPAYGVLDPRTPMPEPTEGEDETSIFQTLRSNWLSADGAAGQAWTTSQVEAGWVAAEQAAEAPQLPVRRSGLPMRRPGHLLVPGGVAPAVAPVARDPEAIRERLAAHAAGVSRGRRVAGDEPNAPSTEETGAE